MGDSSATHSCGEITAGDSRELHGRAAGLLEPLGVMLLLGLLLVVSLERRLPQLQRPFWEDEVHHNFAILRAKNLFDLRWSIQAQQQPLLDYALRKVVWFNILGYQELQLRLPSLLASLATVGAVFLTTYFRLRRSGGRLLAAALAVSLGCWAATNSDEIYYAAEARHYSFVSLVSVLWVTLFLFSERLPKVVFVLGSVVFLNTHFFSIPLVCTGLALKASALERRVRLAGVLKTAGIGALLLAGTIEGNFPAFRWLVTGPPGDVASFSWGRLADALRGGAALWGEFDKYLGCPVPVLALGFALLVFAAAGIERRKVLSLLALSFLILPGLLVYFRLRSNYAFGSRYFTPFFGLGFAMLLAVATCLIAAVSRAASRIGRRWVSAVGAVAIGGVSLLTFRVPGTLAQVADLSTLRLPASNFSPYFQLYGELRASQRPLFVLHSHCWANDIPLLYFQYVGGEPYRSGYQVADSKGCEMKASDAREALRLFLAINPRGLVVLDDKEQDCSKTRNVRAAGLVTVERVRLPVCVWKISGASSIDEVRAIAEAVGFPSVVGLF